MSPKTHRNLQKIVEQLGRILLAISALKNKQFSYICEAAYLYDVSLVTLYDWLHSRVARTEKHANEHKLTITEENMLLQWILSLDRHGAAPWPASVQDMTNILFECSPPDTPYHVGKNWVYNFINCHKELKTWYLQRYNHQCAKCKDPKIIHEWFEL